jgi:hypothetical protein
MRDTVVILHADAINDAQRICAGLADYDIYLFDPLLGDPVAASGLRNVELIATTKGLAYQAMDQAAHSAAHELECELDLARRDSGTAISMIGWQHLNFYYLFMTLQWYATLPERLGPRLQQRRFHLLVNESPATYYFNSFLPSLPLALFLHQHGIEFKTYEYGSQAPPLYPIPDFRRAAPPPGSRFVLTHLPTCVYDVEYFCAELRAAGVSAANLEAKYWNVPVPAQWQIGLVDAREALAALAPALTEQLGAFTQTVSDTLDRRLAKHLPLAPYRARQVEHLVQLYRSQLLTFFELQRHFGDAGPFKLLLSDHDTGFHGPLVSFAEQQSIPVLLLPHSKTICDIEFSYRDIVALTHPAQGCAIRNANAEEVRSLPIAFPERFAGSSEIGGGPRVATLMLNGLALNGIPFAPLDGYLDGIRRLVAWFDAADIKLKIRCKPGYSIIRLLNATLGIDPQMLMHGMQEPMEAHLHGCDLCLMYDLPTTGALHFLRNSIVILNPVVTEMTLAFRATVDPQLIAPESIDACLARLDGFKSDPLSFYAYRLAQYHGYVSRFQLAQPLRSHLRDAPPAPSGAARH